MTFSCAMSKFDRKRALALSTFLSLAYVWLTLTIPAAKAGFVNRVFAARVKLVP